MGLWGRAAMESQDESVAATRWQKFSLVLLPHISKPELNKPREENYGQ